jgi:hypothetical protein
MFRSICCKAVQAVSFSSTKHKHKHRIISHLSQFTPQFAPLKIWFVNCQPRISWQINSMEPSPSWQAGSCTATQEFPNFLWNLNFHYRAHKSPPLVMKSAPSHSVSPKLISILFSHLCLGFHSGHFFWLNPHTFYMHCSSHPPWLDIPIILAPRLNDPLLLRGSDLTIARSIVSLWTETTAFETEGQLPVCS